MLFKKLFRVLVMGGAMIGAGTASGCAANAQTESDAAKKKAPQPADAGTAPDAGKADQGGGASGW